MKDLIIKITGSVQEQNLAEFEASAMSILESINLDLVTDEDFAEADKATKDCKLVETRIANAKNKAMHDQREISELFTLMDKLSDKFRNVRLELEKKVKDEKVRRKSEIVKEFEKMVFSHASRFPCLKHFKTTVPNFDMCVKGKRSLVEMRKACSEAYDAAVVDINEAAKLWTANNETLLLAEKAFPSLFPDKDVISAKPVDELSAIVNARIAQHKLAMKEKEEREQAEKGKKQVEVPPPPVFEEPSFTLPPVFEPPTFTIPDTTTDAIEFRLIVTVRNNDLVSALESIRRLPEVISALED